MVPAWALLPLVVLATPDSGMATWRAHLFAVMSRNAGRASRHFPCRPTVWSKSAKQIEI